MLRKVLVIVGDLVLNTVLCLSVCLSHDVVLCGQSTIRDHERALCWTSHGRHAHLTTYDDDNKLPVTGRRTAAAP